MEVLIKKDSGQLARAGAEICRTAALEAVQKKGRFTLVLSGGSTPRPMHRLLAREPHLGEIPWDKTHIFWVDERCLEPNDPESNYGQAEEDFLIKIPLPQNHIHPMPATLPPEQGARFYQKTITDFFDIKKGQFPVFDLIYLGLGTDGHTASLFPGQTVLNEKRRLIVPVKGGRPDVNRLTMTLPLINRAKQKVFLVSGSDKARAVKRVVQDRLQEMPAGRVRPEKGKLSWLLDQEAAALLEKPF
ncbi:MAG: 6-phosphogluconolactonase [Desulfohalobiaceae bacterium]|nr:6-phosphogluconolactonase [Desulfohalobiaceae bacterium]